MLEGRVSIQELHDTCSQQIQVMHTYGLLVIGRVCQLSIWENLYLTIGWSGMILRELDLKVKDLCIFCQEVKISTVLQKIIGLTAYVTKDPATGETVWTVMEQQTVSIAKAGIIASLNARTSVLACANPSGSRYNLRLSVIDNIHLPPTLLSRFDLIYLILDKADEQMDRRLAKHIVALHFENPESMEQDVLDLPTLTSYVSFSRKHIHPQLSDEAAEEMTRGYIEIRKRGNFPGSSKKVITATPRQIENLIRLSEALARIRFSEWVEKHDVMEAFRLLEVAMQQSATDHSTGTIDMDLITTGVSASERTRRESLLQSTRNIIMEKMQIGGPSMLLLELLEELKKLNTGSEVHLTDLKNAVATRQRRICC